MGLGVEKENKHFYYMDLALEQAKISLKNNEVPVGAVIVDENDKIIGSAFNQMEKLGCQSKHAEVIAIEQACKKRGDWRLDGCSIYITLEPCVMCFGLISLSRFKAIYFGAHSPLFGFGLDNVGVFPLYKKDLFIEGGIKAQNSMALLKDFFKEKRIKKGSSMKQRLNFIAKMKQDLLSRKDELAALIEKMSHEETGERDQVKDSGDEALASTMDRLQSSIQRTEIDELKLIEQAIIRIDKNEYGICIDCGEAINLKRLGIYPYAARCISCQEDAEV